MPPGGSGVVVVSGVSPAPWRRGRGGVALMPELGYAPVNRYLPPRPRRHGAGETPETTTTPEPPGGIARWIDRLLHR